MPGSSNVLLQCFFDRIKQIIKLLKCGDLRIVFLDLFRAPEQEACLDDAVLSKPFAVLTDLFLKYSEHTTVHWEQNHSKQLYPGKGIIRS